VYESDPEQVFFLELELHGTKKAAYKKIRDYFGKRYVNALSRYAVPNLAYGSILNDEARDGVFYVYWPYDKLNFMNKNRESGSEKNLVWRKPPEPECNHFRQYYDKVWNLTYGPLYGLGALFLGTLGYSQFNKLPASVRAQFLNQVKVAKDVLQQQSVLPEQAAQRSFGSSQQFTTFGAS
jgi:hypothetical protein